MSGPNLWIDQGSGPHDVLAVCSECRPQWREWAKSRTAAEHLLLDHALGVHGVKSAAYQRMKNRFDKRESRRRP